MAIGGGSRPAGASNRVVCACNDGLGRSAPGAWPSGMWEPARHRGAGPAPNCSPALGGIRLPLGGRASHGLRGATAISDASDGAFYNYHWYAFPLLILLDLFWDDRCNPDGYVDLDLLYLSELDPTWNNDELAFFTNPEAAWLANPIALAACMADAVAASAGHPHRRAVLVCRDLGRDVSRSPGTGARGRGPARPVWRRPVSLAALHRRGLARRTMGDDAMCDAPIAPFIPKSQYKLSMFYPMPETQRAHVIGESPLHLGGVAQHSRRSARTISTCSGAGTTAVRPSERSPSRCAPWRRSCASPLAWTPWALAWGQDVMRANGLAGQAAGQAAAAGVAAPSLQGNALVLPGGQTLDVQALFPDSGGDAAAFSQWYGDDAAAVGNGRQAQGRLANEASPSGNAYRALQQSVGRDRPDRRNDPLWRQTDLVNDGLDDLARSFADCQNTIRFDQGERQVHIPDLRTCEWVPEGGNCAWFHDYSLPPADTLVTAWGGATVSDCGVGCAQVAYHHGNALVQYGKQFPPALPAQTFGFTVADQGRVNTVTVSVIPQDPFIQFETTRPDWPLRADKLLYQYLVAFPGYSYVAVSPGVWEPIIRPAVVGRDATADLRGGGSFTILNNLQARNDGSEIWYSGSWTYDVTVTVSYTPIHRPAALDWGWTDNPQCTALFGQVQAGGCAGSVQCLGAPALAANGCYQDTGVQVCPGDLAQPPVAVSPFCREVRVSADCSTINTGPMDCWTDTQGTVQCPQNGGGPGDCAALENDPSVRSCANNASRAARRTACATSTSKSGTAAHWPTCQPWIGPQASIVQARCAAWAGTVWTPPASSPPTSPRPWPPCKRSKWRSATPIARMLPTARCFPAPPANARRPWRASSTAARPQEGCRSPTTCRWSWRSAEIDSAVMGMDKGSVIRGGWETLRQPLDSTWTAVTDGFTSVANNLMGQAAPQVNDALAKLSLEGFKQELMHATAQWAADTFGPSAVNALFAAETGGAAVGANGQVVSDALTLGGPLGTMMLYVMYAYMIYTIVMILIKIIWTCEKAEFELGAKRELKACHPVGSYCKSKVLGWCIEKRESYCCFNTPLARIMNEQIRPQIGRSWGTAKNPECSGIAVGDFARVDWNRVNLDEWLAILMQTGHFPTLDSLDLAALTGDGSVLNTGGRLDAATRTLERSDGLDSGQIRQDAEDELWGQANLGAGGP